MRILNVKVPRSFSWVLEIYNLVIRGKDIFIRELLMLSSRFSGKTHNILLVLFVFLMLQKKQRIVINFVRARAKDCEEELGNFVQELLYYAPNLKIRSNGNLGIIECNGNKIKFVTLNEEKMKVQKNGGKVGVVLEPRADYIFTFYEETSQLNEDLVENHRHSIRGNKDTKMMFIYASNPWLKSHWFMKKFIKVLPEGPKQEKELMEKGYNSHWDPATKSLYFRPRWTMNKAFLKQENIDEIDRLKDLNYNKWKIVSLGFSGTLTNSLYTAALEKADTKLQEHPLEHQFFGGVDYGDGKSSTASPTYATICGISLSKGIDVYGEFQWENNKAQTISMIEIQQKVVQFYVDFWNQLKFKKKITVYVDNAAFGDFWNMFQDQVNKMGHKDKIEILPVFKPKNTWERVETVNGLLALQVLRLNPEITPTLWYYLENCYEKIKTDPSEETKRERSHEFTHGVHALEYAISDYIKDFQSQIPLFENKSLGKYAISF